MTLKIEGDDVIFSTGRKVYANCGIIGLSPGLEVSEGYDGEFDVSLGGDLTPQERAELADHMIAEWRKYGEQR